MKIRQKLLKLFYNFTDKKIEKFIDFVGDILSSPVVKATGWLVIFQFVYDSLQEEPSIIFSVWMAALIIYLLSKIIGGKANNITNHNYQNPKFDTAYFSDKETISKALNKLLSDNQKASSIIDLLDLGLDFYGDCELEEKITACKLAKSNCWKTQKVRKWEGKIGDSEYKIHTEFKNDIEYQKAKDFKQKKERELRDYIKDQFI